MIGLSIFFLMILAALAHPPEGLSIAISVLMFVPTSVSLPVSTVIGLVPALVLALARR